MATRWFLRVINPKFYTSKVCERCSFVLLTFHPCRCSKEDNWLPSLFVSLESLHHFKTLLYAQVVFVAEWPWERSPCNDCPPASESGAVRNIVDRFVCPCTGNIRNVGTFYVPFIAISGHHPITQMDSHWDHVFGHAFLSQVYVQQRLSRYTGSRCGGDHYHEAGLSAHIHCWMKR